MQAAEKQTPKGTFEDIGSRKNGQTGATEPHHNRAAPQAAGGSLRAHTLPGAALFPIRN
jgi:hypothetical protein